MTSDEKIFISESGQILAQFEKEFGAALPFLKKGLFSRKFDLKKLSDVYSILSAKNYEAYSSNLDRLVKNISGNDLLITSAIDFYTRLKDQVDTGWRLVGEDEDLKKHLVEVLEQMVASIDNLDILIELIRYYSKDMTPLLNSFRMYFATEGENLRRWFIIIITSSNIVSAEEYVINLASAIDTLNAEIENFDSESEDGSRLALEANNLLKELKEISHLIDTAPQDLINEYLD